MKIGILEIGSINHEIGVRTIAKIFKGHEVFVFVNHNLAINIQDLVNEGVKIFVKESCEHNFFDMINDIYLDFLFITTLQTDFNDFWKFKPKAKTFVNFRSSNNWVRKFPNNLKPKEIAWHILRQRWKRRMFGCSVGIQNQKDFLINEGFKKPILVLPFSIYEPSEERKENAYLNSDNEILKVVIPGMVSELRRENLKFLDALEILPKEYRDKISINFLGAPGKEKADKYSEILFKVLDLKNKGFNIVLHNNFIPIQKYKKQIDEADLILGNILVKCGKERYNESKDTGITHLMVSHSKIGLLPRVMKSIEELKSSTILFNDYLNLVEILKSLINNNERLNRLKDSARINSLKFTLDKVSKDVLSFVK